MRVHILKKGEMVRESDMHKSTERMWWWDRYMFPWVRLVKTWISLIVTGQYWLISWISQWKWGYYCWNVWRLVSTQYTLFDHKISCIIISHNTNRVFQCLMRFNGSVILPPMHHRVLPRRFHHPSTLNLWYSERDMKDNIHAANRIYLMAVKELNDLIP